MATPITCAGLTTLPSDILIEIFSRCNGAINARALGCTSSRLYHVYKDNDAHIHSALAVRVFGSKLVSALRAGDPSRMSPETSAFLSTYSYPIDPKTDFRYETTKNEDHLLSRFLSFLLPEFEMWKPINAERYRHISCLVRNQFWIVFKSFFPVEEKWMKAYRQQYHQIQNATKATSRPDSAACSDCEEGSCLWHGGDGHRRLNPSYFFDVSFIEEYNIRCLADRVLVRKRQQPLSTPILWDGFVDWLHLYTTTIYRLPSPPGFDCEKSTCTICKDLRVPVGGYHIWDKSSLEGFSKQQIDAIRLSERKITDPTVELSPVFSGYQPTKAETQATFDTDVLTYMCFYPYWEGLSEFCTPDPVTGLLTSLDSGKRRFFSGEGEEYRMWVYNKEEVEIMLPTGDMETKMMVVDRMEWDHVMWRREELVRRHRGEKPRRRHERPDPNDPEEQRLNQEIILELLEDMMLDRESPTIGLDMADLDPAQKMAILATVMKAMGSRAAGQYL
ncbi:hypothetical protein BJ508DRAFT_34791 [Ascobolus immersus RN42]|uniref:F-box domain-containing protein n=1 Tax=Ascobolus immersus RN42 TaxID=1160509 RepID=A0A3N4HKT1_ASCIM|nr:hypothetical protein BJ508DRAFT_34791 [Ascobolus immersus RN42]